MEKYYDAIVVGAGHAGVEAAYHLAKVGYKTALLTINIEHIAKMPCNPSVGGPAKGVVVREIDALGGIMPKVADETALQFKMLNTAKGPGVQCLRVQSDKLAYSARMKEICLSTENLDTVEDTVEEVLVENGKAKGVRLLSGDTYLSKVLILTTGTYMDSTVMISSEVRSEGPDGDHTTRNLSESLRNLGLRLFRLKTGTPPRIRTASIDFSKTKLELGTKEFVSFSTETEKIRPYEEQVPCYLTYTTPETLKIIHENLNRSSMYSGVVKGIGPRYCPSIEDKVVRFSDKPRHQLFLEPESLSLDTTYIQGFSSSMPRDVQEKMVHSLIGLENAEIVKYAYAIEHDAIDPLEFKINLESKKIENLFIAGQILGTSGYEEAAGLGKMAGINAQCKLEGREPFVLRRDEAYIGVMIDDLITKGTNEPYRLLTSRAEYRLLLRHDNAEERLLAYGYQYGSVSKERYERYLSRQKEIDDLIAELPEMKIKSDEELSVYLTELGYDDNKGTYSLYDLVKRPKVSLAWLLKKLGVDKDKEVIDEVEISLKYEGYINKAKRGAERMIRLEKKRLPQNIDYMKVDNLRLEARQKLNQIKPATLGQAARISGINPSDLQVLAVYLKRGDLVNEL